MISNYTDGMLTGALKTLVSYETEYQRILENTLRKVQKRIEQMRDTVAAISEK